MSCTITVTVKQDIFTSTNICDTLAFCLRRKDEFCGYGGMVGTIVVG